ncbi:RIP metalloprotease RseP [Flavobacterium sp.]|uniref:RIP metalloprotease RseP n=1 Tax=Flavobacterium sp. TaxID=239 RepID=UPI002607B7FF|nr:RIP metalloprotease RseP [Flavobacterium sp.]
MIQVAQIIFILSVLVILHEFGHYIAAKIFKVRVEKFYLFMDAGFSIIKKKIGETEWGIGWLPIGGYVKLSGMIDESMDTEQMKQEPQPWEFRSKPAWQRLIIMLGGIIVNIILAITIYTIMFSTVGQKYIATETIQKNGLSFTPIGKEVGFQNGDKIISVDGEPVQNKFNRLIIDVLLSDKLIVERNGQQKEIALTDESKAKILGTEGKNFMMPRIEGFKIDSILPKSGAFYAGLKINDQITAVNGTTIKYYDEFTNLIANKANDSISLVVLRNNTPVNLKAKLDKDGKLGFRPSLSLANDKEKFEVVNKLSFAQALPQAVKESWQLLVYNVKQFKLILKPKTQAYKQVKSPIGIARMLPDEWNWEFIWSFTALFSIGLAFMNLLPIPGLDGGHALFTIAEMITGKKLSEKNMGYVQTAGMIILLTLMALTFGKDIYQLVMDKFFTNH